MAGRFSLGALSLVVANSGLLVLYFVYDVTLFQLVLVYWCECVWIGAFSAIKLITASMIGDPYENRWAEVSGGAGLFMSLLVIVFSSTAFFSLLGMILLAILFANESLALSSAGDDLYRHIGLVLGVSLLLMAGHAISFVGNFLLLGEYKLARIGMLIALPFKRCIALLVAILASIVFITTVPGLANTAAFAVIVIVLKGAWDIRLHFSERRELAWNQR
jgi:hypothetical protein